MSSRETFDRGGILYAFYYDCYITSVIILPPLEFVGSQMILFVNVATGITQGMKSFAARAPPPLARRMNRGFW